MKVSLSVTRSSKENNTQDELDLLKPGVSTQQSMTTHFLSTSTAMQDNTEKGER